ncbi:CAA30379.1 protein [Hibiscus syriacus]|uniref:CAA30379.1 protein n=1 Tax=Hibiscus syriacus TaxID=106335 RepID=A0A6A3B482_HIBSY|nr:CAA30379.1 protein [Hibiscus syriacus]
MKLVQADNYIIHMDLSAMPQAFTSRESWHMSTLSSLSANTNATIPTAKLIYSYNHAIHGFSASLTPAQLEALKNAPGYVSSVRDRTVKLDTTHSFKFIGLNSHTGMTDVPVKWKGDCESGTEFNSSLCNKKLIGARSFNKGSYTTDIIAAIDQAITDGVDVISMSFGIDNLQLYEDPIAIATFAAIEKNIFVSTSAGNDGPGLGTLHNGIPWVLTVAAGTLDRSFGASISLGTDDFVNGVALYPGNFSSNPFPVVFMNACDDTSELKKLAGSIIVCQDPGRDDSLRDQFDNVQFAGNVAGVFVTNSTQLDTFIQSPFPLFSWNRKTAMMSGPSFSSPSILKPDIMAPGDLILAAWPPNILVDRLNSETMFSNYNLLSGTSMACPHASGIAALLKGTRPDWSAAAIRSALMTTSDPIDNTGSPIKDAAYFNGTNVAADSSTTREFGRTVTNVEKGSFIYKATLTPIKGFKATVEPDTLGSRKIIVESDSKEAIAVLHRQSEVDGISPMVPHIHELVQRDCRLQFRHFRARVTDLQMGWRAWPGLHGTVHVL